MIHEINFSIIFSTTNNVKTLQKWQDVQMKKTVHVVYSDSGKSLTTVPNDIHCTQAGMSLSPGCLYCSVGEKLAAPLMEKKEHPTQGMAKSRFLQESTLVLFKSLIPKARWNVLIRLIHLRGGHCSEGLLWPAGISQQVPHGRQGIQQGYKILHPRRRTWKLWLTAD